MYSLFPEHCLSFLPYSLLGLFKYALYVHYYHHLFTITTACVLSRYTTISVCLYTHNFHCCLLPFFPLCFDHFFLFCKRLILSIIYQQCSLITSHARLHVYLTYGSSLPRDPDATPTTRDGSGIAPAPTPSGSFIATLARPLTRRMVPATSYIWLLLDAVLRPRAHARCRRDGNNLVTQFQFAPTAVRVLCPVYDAIDTDRQTGCALRPLPGRVDEAKIEREECAQRSRGRGE